MGTVTRKDRKYLAPMNQIGEGVTSKTMKVIKTTYLYTSMHAAAEESCRNLTFRLSFAPMRVTCLDHYSISTPGKEKKKKRRRGCMLCSMHHLVLLPFDAQFFSVCARQTNAKSWQAAVFWRLLIHRRADLGTLAQSLGRLLAVADRAALTNAPDSASRRLLLLLINPKVSPLTEWSCRLQVQAQSPLETKMRCCGCVCSSTVDMGPGPDVSNVRTYIQHAAP
jgi:hypothetical protein